MKPLDKNYLSLQFRNKIHSKNGTEFQSFFESIAEKVFSGFRKIRPLGNKGDAGNDGYLKDSGIYYQVYAPNTPKVSETTAAEKLVDDFQKIKEGWDEISKIKEYNFVFNDKYGGSVQLLEAKNSNLKAENPDIEFKLFLANDLEKVFFQLSESDILGLGFNIDQRQAISNAYIYLESVKTEFDRENAFFARKLLENIKDIILVLGDENLSLEYEILECRCLQKFEQIDDARKKYGSISKRFPHDPRSFLYLAEIYLNDEDFSKNNELLEKVEGIDNDFWLLKLEQILRKLRVMEQIDIKDIDENTFPSEPKIKSNFYRLYGIFLENSGDQTNADRFIEKAIHLNPERFSSYIDQLFLIENRLILSQNIVQRSRLSRELLDKIEELKSKYFTYGDIGSRNKAILNSKKLNALLAQENISDFEDVAKETFELLMACYFDVQIELIIKQILQFVSLPDNDLHRLLDYLKSSKKGVSDDLSKALIAQFNIRDALLTEGIRFFEEIKSQKYLGFITDLGNKDYDKVLAFIKQDIGFAIVLANTLKTLPDLRKQIIENLPDEDWIQKEKLWLLLNFDEKDFDQAFQILKKLDLSNLNSVECKPMLYIAQQKEAWDFEATILEKLLEKEKNEKEIFNLKFRLLYAFLNLKKFLKVMEIGELLLNEDATKHLLDQRSKEGLLNNTLIACLERGKVDNEAFKMARELLEKFELENPSFDFRVGVEAETYLGNKEAENALKAVIEAVKTKKILLSRTHFIYQ